MYVKVVRSLKIMFEGHKVYQKQLDQILQTSIEPKQSHSGAIIRGVGMRPQKMTFFAKNQISSYVSDITMGVIMGCFASFGTV